MSTQSLYWYDYETFGIDPRADRIAQFAGVRTDMNFNIIDTPIDILCRATDDILPNPEACLITGITPQSTLQHGLIEAEFISQIEITISALMMNLPVTACTAIFLTPTPANGKTAAHVGILLIWCALPAH